MTHIFTVATNSCHAIPYVFAVLVLHVAGQDNWDKYWISITEMGFNYP